MPQHSSTTSNSSPPHRQDCDATSLALVMEQERRTAAKYACHDYLTRSVHGNCGDDSSPRHNKIHRITPEDRTKLVDWCYDVVDRCRFDRETVAAAVDIADRFVSTRGNRPQEILRDRGQYQLVIMTSLYISIKICERSVLSSEDFGAISRGAYSKEDIESMERTILQGLEWRLLCRPTALYVGREILELLSARVGEGNIILKSSGAWDFFREEVAFQTERAVRGYYFVTQCPSTVAAAAILTAIEGLNDDGDCKLLMEALLCVLEEFEFESESAILNAWDELRHPVEESEGPPLDDGPTLVTALIEEALEAYEACHRSAAAAPKRMRDQSEPSSSCSVADNEQNDDSCATVY